MKKYNLYYRVGKEIIQKRNITKEEIDVFLNSLQKHPDCEIKITQNKEKDEEER